MAQDLHALTGRLEKVEEAVEKARDAKLSLEGAWVMLEELKSKVEKDDSWATKRCVVEALVAGIEIETEPRAIDMRGRGKVITL